MTNMNDDKRVTLKLDNMELEIASGVGGSISKFGYWEEKDGKKEFIPILRNAPKKADVTNQLIASDMSCHTGVPFLNRVEECELYGKKIGAEQNHPFVPHRIHGDAWQEAWKLENYDEKSAVISYEHDGKKGFPFKYKATQKISLTKNGFSIDVDVKNLEKNKPIPLGTGLHFYWTRTDNMEITANNDKLQFDVATDNVGVEERKTPEKMNCKETKKINDIHGLDANFTNPDGKFDIHYPEFNKTIEVKTTGNHSKNFLTICVPDWTHALCAEPLTHAVYGTSDLVKGTKTAKETGIMMIEPNQSIKMTTKTKILPLSRQKNKEINPEIINKIAGKIR